MVQKKYIHLSEEINNRKHIGPNPRWDIFLDIERGKMKYKGFLPWTILYKGSYFWKQGHACARDEEGGVYLLRGEAWLSSRWPTGWLREESEEFKTCFSFGQGSSLSKFIQDLILWIWGETNFNYTFGIFEN